MSIPVVSIVGKKSSGKTRLVENLVLELKKRGYSVGTIKHCDCEIKIEDVDREGKDTYKHYKAGADRVVLSAKKIFVLFSSISSSKTIDELMGYFKGQDIILTEGFKKDNKPKIEVVSDELICKLEERLVAIVSDKKFDISIPSFGKDDFSKIVDFLEEKFILPKKDKEIELFVEDKKIPLNKFVSGFLKTTILGMLSSLKGIPKTPKKIEIIYHSL